MRKLFQKSLSFILAAAVAVAALPFEALAASVPVTPSTPLNMMVGSYLGADYGKDVAVSGDYAYVAEAGAGLQIFSLTDRTNPVVVGNYPALTSVDHVAVSGSTAYITDSGYLKAINVTDPTAPALLGQIRITKGQKLLAAGSYVYVIDSVPALRIIDMTDPTHPTEKSELYNSLMGTVTTGFVSGQNAYLYDGTNLYVADVSDVAAPKLVGQMELDESAVTNMFAANSTVYLTRSSGTAAGSYTSGVMAVNVSNAASPTLSFNYALPNTSGANALYVADGKAYVAGANFFYILDVSGAAPSILRQSITYNGDSEWFTTNVCNALTFDGQYAYLANNFYALSILDTTAGLKPENPDITFRDHTQAANTASLTAVSVSVPNLAAGGQDIQAGDAKPAVFRLSDAVKPGELITAYGENMTNDSKMAFSPVTDNSALPAAPPAGSTQVTVSKADTAGQSATAVMPSSLAAGSYYVWVSNGSGWSLPSVLNGARPQWISQEQAAPGLMVAVVGQNFDGTEFGAAQNAQVILSDGTHAYQMPLNSVNPYEIKFTVSNIPAGSYDVLVSNDGGKVWRKSEDNIKLGVVASVTDPLGLGVAWANDFNWTKYTVTDAAYGANGSDSADDSSAFQAAINAAGVAGGGEVYIPNGNYILNQPLTLPAGVTLVGQSRTGTVVTYIHPDTDKAGSAVISMQGDAAANIGKVGLANFTLKVDPNTPFDSILWLGHNWSSVLNSDQSLRTATDIFVLNMNISSAYNRLPVGRSLGELFFAKKNVLVRGSNFSGYQNTISSARSGDYVECSDNDFYTDVSNLSLGGCHYLQENNILSRNFSASQDPLNFITSQGSWTRGYAYAADNTVKNTGMPGWNEGEIIANEGYGGGTKMFGTVTSATATSLTLSPLLQSDGSLAGNAGLNNWTLVRAYGDWYVTIISGRGLGQARKIVGLDSAGKTCTVDQPWDVQPDATSRFVINLPNVGAIFYHNTAQNCGASFIFYNYAYDSVIAENTGFYTEGGLIYGGSLPLDKRTDFFSRIERNTFTGGGNKSGLAEAGVYAGLETPDPYGTVVYGIAIKGNTIQNVTDPTYLKRAHSVTATGLVVAVDARVQPIDGAGNDMVRTITIENNTVKNATTGIVLGDGTITHGWDHFTAQYSLVSNIITKNNTLKNVGTAVIDTGVAGRLDLTPLSESVNLAFDKTAFASSGDASKAVDGDDSTAWTAPSGSTQTLTVDLGVSNSITGIHLGWGAGYATAYKVQVADTNDASTVWQDAYTTTSGNGGSDDLTLTNVKGRYVRLSATASSGGAYSLSEFEVNGVPAPKLLTAKTGTDGKSIVLTFDRPLAELPASPAGFSVTRGADAQALAVSSVLLSDDMQTVTLALSNTIVYTDTNIRVSYAPATVQTRYGGAPLGAIAGQDVANLAPIPLPQPAPIPAGANLVKNPGFETGASSWSNYGCVITPVTDSASVHSGSKSVKISSRTQAWTGPRQDILSQMQNSGSGQYYLSGWFKVASSTVTSAPLKVNLEYHYTLGGVSTTKNVFTDVSNSSKWPTNSQFTQVSGLVNIAIPDGATLTFAQVELFADGSASPYIDFYADDISVQKVADKTALTAAIQSATALLGSKPVGTAVGSVPQSAHDVLAAAITAANAVNAVIAPLQTNVDIQTAALTAAITAFNSAVKTTAAPVAVTLDATSGVQAGGTATLTATITGADGGVPSGTVSFTVDGNPLGTPVQLDSTGKAVFTWTNAPAGTHVLEAQYGGDLGYLPGTGTLAPYEVSKLIQAALVLDGVPQGVTYGDAPFTLSVSGGSGGGALSYSVAGSAVTVDADGQVSVQNAGTAVVTVTKAGDDTYNPASASVSITVAKKQSSITTLPTASGVTAPATLSESTLTGGAGSVPGVFTWSQPDASLSESGSFEVTFTPADTANYLPGTGLVPVAVTARRLTDDVTGVHILLSQDVLPDGLSLQDVRLAVENVGGAPYAAAQTALSGVGTRFSLFDIRLLAGDASVEPTKPVQVSLPIPDGFNTAHLALYYIKDDGTAEPVTGGSVQGGLYVFMASHFSSYALVDTSVTDTSPVPSQTTSSGSTSSNSTSSVESTGNPPTGVETSAGAAVVLFGAAACAALLFGRRRRNKHNVR